MSSERTVHVPVMVHEVLEQLALSTGLTILDGTIGGGGHSRKILEHMPSGCRLIGMDRDPAMLARAGQVLGGENVHLAQGSYAELDRVLDELRIPAVDRVLLDLGLSSDQLADPQRGFGFSTAGDLDMRFDQSTGSPAAELLASAEEEELTRIFTEYGDEPQAGRIARQIVEQRRHQPLRTAAELRTLIESLPASRGQTHPATRVFQALRIAVNQELDQLQSFLDDVPPRLHQRFHAVLRQVISCRRWPTRNHFRTWERTRSPRPPWRRLSLQVNEMPRLRCFKTVDRELKIPPCFSNRSNRRSVSQHRFHRGICLPMIRETTRPHRHPMGLGMLRRCDRFPSAQCNPWSQIPMPG